jgi:chitinase
VFLKDRHVPVPMTVSGTNNSFPLNVLEKYYGILQTLDYKKGGCPISNSTSETLKASNNLTKGQIYLVQHTGLKKGLPLSA